MAGEGIDESRDRGEGEGRGLTGQPRISLLDDALIDQIAAGEVVERPASVVKELVENALDAQARRLRVEIREGGSAWIAVADDGVGMEREDLRRALQRHATSKIRRVEDLSRIASFGFRGEALPAIASVSRMRVVTRLRGAPEARELRVEAGRVLAERACGAPEGTRIEVAELFASVPARRKFLKRPATEWAHACDWLTRSALALPEVHYEIARDERPALVWPVVRDPLERIAAVLSEADAAALVAGELEEAAGRARVWASSPERTRANAQALYLYVNGRPVRDPLLRGAVLSAYRDWLPRGRYPTVILFVDLPPERVDVNVHPAKWEVRFADPSGVRQLVRHVIRDAMAGRSWLAGSQGRAPARSDRRPAQLADTSSQRARPAEAARPGPGDWLFAGDRGDEASLLRDAPTPPAAAAVGEPEAQVARHTTTAEEGVTARVRFGQLRLVGQLLASYLLVESKGGLLLVDQHAAHERVLYERLRQEWLERGVEQQLLLEPVVVNLDPVAASALGSQRARAGRLGFDVDAFGEGAIALRAVPALLGDRDPAELARELAEELAEAPDEDAAGDDDVRLLHAADRTLATLACHSARRFGDLLEPPEQRAILDALDVIPWAPTCPHGRPVAVSLERAEIERRFGRR